jgi:PD-(D/E)XK nuclease superfamily protein
MTRKAEKLQLICKDESHAIIGACFAVYKDKGCGFLEPVSVSGLADEHRAQLLNYLSATGCKLGLPVNFGHPRMEYERLLSRNQEPTDVQL